MVEAEIEGFMLVVCIFAAEFFDVSSMKEKEDDNSADNGNPAETLELDQP